MIRPKFGPTGNHPFFLGPKDAQLSSFEHKAKLYFGQLSSDFQLLFKLPIFHDDSFCSSSLNKTLYRKLL